jgi:hypothetical protein
MRVTINTSRGFDAQTTVLQPDGSFEFGGLAPGKYEVFASVRGYRAPPWDYRSQTERPGTVEIDRGVDGFVLTMDPVK